MKNRKRVENGRRVWRANLTNAGKGRIKGVPNKATMALKAYAGQYTTEAIDGLVALARGAKVPPAARVMAWNAVLDRGNGKPPQALTGLDGEPLMPREVIHQHLVAAVAITSERPQIEGVVESDNSTKH